MILILATSAVLAILAFLMLWRLRLRVRIFWAIAIFFVIASAFLGYLLWTGDQPAPGAKTVSPRDLRTSAETD